MDMNKLSHHNRKIAKELRKESIGIANDVAMIINISHCSIWPIIPRKKNSFIKKILDMLVLIQTKIF